MNKTGIAGNRGPDVRSDCYVEFTEKQAGGRKIELHSKVAALYRKSITALAGDVLDTFEIEHARLLIEDTGAFDFVLAARIEAAIKKTLHSDKEFLLPMLEQNRFETAKDAFRFSRLYLPGNSPKLMLNAGIHHPNGVILDLEDSVAPDKKFEVRFLIRNVLRNLDFYGAERMVRINQIPEGLDELQYLVPHYVNLILIPKCENADDIHQVNKAIDALKKEHQMSRQVWLMPIIESAKGVIKAYEIASAAKNVVALAIGLEDYTADIGTRRTNEGTESFFARSMVVNAARAAGIQPIDSVFSDVSDMEALAANVNTSKSLGFDGMGCIHPRQIKVIHDNFAPGTDEIEKAKKIVIAFKEAESKGLGVVSLGSKMIDPPVVKRAQKTITLAIKTGKLDENWISGGLIKKKQNKMKKYDKTVQNAAGRTVPSIINGEEHIPFKGVGKHKPDGRRYGPKLSSCVDYPADGNKVVKNLREALMNAGIKDGMTISTHHHFRNGDLVANQIFEIAHELGIKDLRWYPSASFPCQEKLIEYLEDGTINRIEGSMNGPLGRFTSEGRMKGMAILRSHGGRYQAVQDGEVQIDIAVIAAPTADPFGNANGVEGDAACGLLGFALADSQYAEKVIVVTDNLVPFPCIPWQIHGNYVDYVVKVDQVGLPERIISGTTQITKSPDRLLIAEITAQFCEAAGLIYDGFSYQAGAGGTSLSIGNYFGDILRKNNWKARFIRAGSNKYAVDLLEQGVVDYILDGQTFDLEGVRSMRENPNHVNTSPFTSYNYHGKGNFASMVDVVILGATEVDVNYNANVVTHSDGYMLHGIGGWQNCLFSKCTILPIPLFRDRIPVIRDEVTTLCGPGELIDVIVTERGIAINPLRLDLIDKTRNSGLPIKTIGQLKNEAEAMCGKPENVELSDEFVAAIKWVDGTVIDAVRKVAK